jgi:protoporphyrinogen oxidase
MSEIVILGGGVTGLAAGIRLTQVFSGRVRVIEKEAAPGGLASTVDLGGWGADLGSHRVHNNYDPRALELIRPLLGDDLVRRTRLGRIRIAGRFLDYPPNALTLLSGIGWKRGIAAFGDYLTRRKPTADAAVNFESYIESEVGRELYRLFYRPYALKLWGVAPSRLAADPAVQRLTKLSARRLRSDAVRFLLRRKPTYLYPRLGIGQIADALREAFVRAGGTVMTSAEVTGVEIHRPASADSPGSRVAEIRLASGQTLTDPQAVISTLPLRRTLGLIGQTLDPEELSYRALRVLYLMYPAEAASPYETFYIPDPEFRIGRVSQPAAYSPGLAADGRTRIFTVEIPCSEGDSVWTAAADTLAADCHRELIALGIIRPGIPRPECRGSVSLPDLYPVHTIGWKGRLESVLDRAVNASGIYPAGRSALFMHCNIDHCLVMGMRLADHLAGGGSAEDWLGVTRSEFGHFQVKD